MEISKEWRGVSFKGMREGILTNCLLFQRATFTVYQQQKVRETKSWTFSRSFHSFVPESLGALMVSLWFTEHSPVYSWYPPVYWTPSGVLIISPWFTENPSQNQHQCDQDISYILVRHIILAIEWAKILRLHTFYSNKCLSFFFIFPSSNKSVQEFTIATISKVTS